MKALLLLAFAVVGQCALLGSKKCTYGPSYWCSHIHHAKECDAMQHCMTTVWKNQRLDMVGSTETCFDIIRVLDVVRHSSEDELMVQWAVGCTGMPAEKRQLCKELMTEDMTEVYKLLKSDLSSKQIAAALHLCGGIADTVPHPRQASGDYCTDCVNFIGDLRDIFNSSEAEAESLVESTICVKLGPMQGLCDQLVKQYVQIAIDMLYQEMDPRSTCALMGMCTNQTHANLMKIFKSMLAKQQVTGVECDLCKNLAQDLQKALQDATLQNDLQAFLKNKVCPLLGSLADQCKSYVDTYIPVVFEILIAELDPSTFCAELGLCNTTKSENGKLTHVPLASPVGTVQILAPEKKADSSARCTLCKYLVQEVEKVIAGKTRQEVQDALEDLCKLLPAEESKECSDFVVEYGPIIIDYLFEEASPDKVCDLVKACPGGKLLQAVKLGVAAKSSEKCEICKYVIEFLKEEVNSSEARTFEEKMLDKVCMKLPTSYELLCEAFVSKYSQAIINLFEGETDPAKLCSVIDLCGKTESPKKSHPLEFQPMVDLRPAQHYLLGTNKCLFGPSFWCASEENARLCNVVEHCRKMKQMENKVDG